MDGKVILDILPGDVVWHKGAVCKSRIGEAHGYVRDICSSCIFSVRICHRTQRSLTSTCCKWASPSTALAGCGGYFEASHGGYLKVGRFRSVAFPDTQDG